MTTPRIPNLQNLRVPNLLVGRKIYHMLMGVSCLVLYSLYLSREEALYLLAMLGLPAVVLDAVRLRIPWLSNWLYDFFRPLLKESERTHMTGHSFFVLGVIVLVYFFPKPIVLLSVLFLTFGDPAASYIGSRWGKHRLPGGKSIEGSLANFVTSFTATAIFLLLYGNDTTYGFIPICLVGAAISMISEYLPLPIDDNFSIPVLSGVLLWAANCAA